MEELLKLLMREVSDLRSGLDGVADEIRELREAVERLREVIEREGRRKVKVFSDGVVKVRGYEELTEGEREVVRSFIEWLVGKERELALRYLEGEPEGIDLKTNRVYLRGITLEEFLYRVSGGVGRHAVLSLLGDVGLLRYKVNERGRRQYCISVRMALFRKERGVDGKVYTRKVSRVGSRYVIDWGRVLELYERVRQEGRRGAIEGSEAKMSGVSNERVGEPEVKNPLSEIIKESECPF